jgi:hypothetical protein
VQRNEPRETDKDLAQLMRTKQGAPILAKNRTDRAGDGTPMAFPYCCNPRGICQPAPASERMLA